MIIILAPIGYEPLTTHHSPLYDCPMRLARLSGRKVCERVKTKGLLWKGKHMQCRVMRGAPRTVTATVPTVFVGVVTSAKLDASAVKRNRMRRRCREALRLVCQERQSSTAVSVQLILLPRSSSLTALFDELLLDARRLLSSLPS